MWGYDQQLVVKYDHWLNAITEEHQPKALDIVTKAISQKSRYEAEYRIINQRTREMRWMRSYGELIYQGDMATHLTGVTLDVTEEVKNKKQLNESRSILNQILDDLHDGFMLFKSIRNLNGQITDFEWTYSNKKAGEIVGKSPDYLIGKHLLVEMPGNKEAGLFDSYVRVVDEGFTFAHEFSYNYEGLNTYFESSAIKVSDGFAVLFNDISDRVNFVNSLETKVAERTEELLKLNKKLIEKNKSLESFNFLIAHHLQEPLRKLQLTLDLFNNRLLSDNRFESGELSERMNELLKNLRSKIVGIRDLKELDAIDLTLFKSVNVAKIIKDIVKDPSYKNSSLKLEIDYENLDPVHSDNRIIEQLFRCLFKNVVDHAGEDSPVKVSIYSKSQKDHIFYFFEDDGKGFDSNVIEKVFDLFTTYSPKKFKDNIGVGLAVVKKIMDVNNGYVEIMTQKGKGTKVKLAFPKK